MRRRFSSVAHQRHFRASQDPLHQDRSVRDFCRDHQIPYVAYSVLGTQWLAAGYSQNPVLNHPVIKDIAHSTEQSPAVVILQWAVQSGAHVIPRSVNVRHIQENARCCGVEPFLSPDAMHRIDALDSSLPNPWG